jgi:hypothetical protein
LLIREVEIRGIVGYKIGDEVFEVRELWEGSDVYLYSRKSQVFSDCRRIAGVNDDVDVCFVLAHILDNFQLLFLRALCIFLPELHLAYSPRDMVLWRKPLGLDYCL